MHAIGEDRRTQTPWRGRAVLHVDMDAFFAAVEQLDHPEWRGLPVIVGGDAGKRGVVATASYEARAFGVHSAMPSARAARLCPDAIWVRGSFARYAEMSAQVMGILARHAAEMQQVSVDEAYLDVTPGAHGADPVEVATSIMRDVAALGITCSVGVATSRTVAKIASDRDKPAGLTVVRPGDEASFLAPLPIRDLPGIGPRTASRLTSAGIRTLGDLAALDDVTATHLLGSHGPATVARAGGVDPRPVAVPVPGKSLSAERTFATDVRTPRGVDVALRELADRVGRRLRRAQLAGRTLTLKIRFADFTTRTVRRTLPAPTDDTANIFRVANELLGDVWTPGVGVRLLGIAASSFEPVVTQMSLSEEDDAAPTDAEARRRAADRAVDAIRERFGPDACRLGGSRDRTDAELYGPE